MFSTWKKSGIVFLTTIVTLGSFFSLLPAQAIPTEVIADVPKAADDIVSVILRGLKVAAMTGVTRAVSYAMRKVSYDTAVWLASGGKGQAPLAFNEKSFDYLKGVGDEAAGSFIEEFGKAGGIDLCKIPDVKVNLALKIGLRTNFLGPTPYGPAGKPNCTLSSFKDNWSGDKLNSKFGSTSAITKDFNATLSTDDSPLGIYGTATEKIGQKVVQQTEAAKADRQEGQGIKSKDTKISNQIQTPAPVVAEQFKANTPDKEQKANQDQVNAAMASGEPGVIASVATIFLDTLVGTVVKNFQDKGVLLGYCVTDACKAKTDAGDNSSLANSYSALYGGGGVAAAQANFNYLQSMTVSEQGYDIISQLNSYSENPGVYNNRIDDSFVLALKQEDTGEPVTIQEAVDRGWLNGDWDLIPPSNPKNNDKLCYKSAFCYSNIQILRQLRILPLGFEIAALRSDPDKPWKLKDLINPLNFNKCPADLTTYDPNSPFCHLIDPNWVLKSPPAKCNALVYSATLLAPNVPDRLQECVDLQTCVSYDASGKCKDFGYCTREKNTWRFAADKCSAQFTTCRAFQDANGKDVAYLYRTLDTAVCKQENVGCQAYSTSQDGKGSWVKAGMINTSGNVDLAGTNSGIFFNNKLSKSCSASADGCSAFAVAGATDTALFLKKAPDYLKCYDADPATTAVEWPKTQADLANVDPSPLCSNYAGVCVPDEVSCNFYTPTAGGSKLPGKFTPAEIVGGVVQKWNDQCDAKCVGYDTYREMPSNYSSGQDIEYMIPASGQVCAAQDEGCTAFTNVSASQGATDKLEYYSYLRPCVLPAKDSGKTYVTYEGTAVSGFQLKTFTLVENKDNTLNGPIGAPKYFARTQNEIDGYLIACNETNYKTGTASPDCRQFNDPTGAVYYRLLSKTVVVSAACTSYRLDNGDFQIDTTVTTRALCDAHQGFMDSNNQCRVCFQNGEYREGSCYYDGLPNGAVTSAGTSRSCSASADTCRAFKGNAGNNIEQVFADTFEVTSTNALVDWTGVTLAAESTHAGEHSVVGNVATNIVRKVTLQTGQSYDLTFWAKGSVSTLVVRVGENNGGSTDVGTVASNDTWNAYHIGPFTYTGATASGLITFAAGQGGSIFLDNVRLVRVKDFVYRVKKTLKVDAICDADQTDNLPGEALGCKAYTDPKNTQYNLVGFSYLCRDNAIGCTAVLDTKNTIDTTGGKASNVWLTGLGGSTPKVTINSKDYSCPIPVGDTGCYINDIIATVDQIKAAVAAMVGATGDGFVSSTVYIGQDTPAASPVYLVANQPATCNQADLGCMSVGAQRLTPHGYDFVTMTIKNDPANYDTQLCTNEAVGCNAYSDGADTRFFKDPAITGQKVCNYRTNVSVKTAGGYMISANGWFWKGVGVCKNDAKKYCSQNSDCDASSCVGIGDQACYKDYLASGEYGLWSSANAKYDNYVGECPTDQDKCTEFVDHNDNNQKYNLIKDNKLTGGDCGDQVSQREGCALFDQTDNPNKFYNAAATYQLSEDGQGKKVSPVDAQGGNDSNIIFKVVRDRVCGEWLACGDPSLQFDQNTGNYKQVCNSINRCNGTGCGPQVKTAYSPDRLTEGFYRNRNLGWTSMEYDGYSLLNMFPVEELKQVNFNTSTDHPDWRLVKLVDCKKNNCFGTNVDGFACQKSGTDCGFVTNGQGQGVCKNNQCVMAINGEKDLAKAPAHTCRVYPEKDSPFPNTDATKNKVQAFNNAHFCSESRSGASKDTAASTAEAYLCDCSYIKAEFGESTNLFWNYLFPNQTDGIPLANAAAAPMPGPAGAAAGAAAPQKGDGIAGICLGGTQNGNVCSDNNSCLGGACQLKTKESKFIGMPGFCLEEDLSRNINGDKDKHPCATWWPNPSPKGVPDAHNQFTEAGFDPLKYGFGNGPFYCAAKENYVFVDKLELTLGGQHLDCDGNAQSLFNAHKADYQRMNVLDFFELISHQGSFTQDPGGLSGSCQSKAANSVCSGYTYLYDSYWGNKNGSYDRATLAANLCSGGSTPSVVTDFEAWSYGCAFDSEDDIQIHYICTYNTGIWQKTADFGFTNLSYAHEDWCTKLYQVGDSALGNKAWTQRTWKKDTSDVPAGGFQNPFDDKCNPFGAAGLNAVPPTNGPVVVTSDCSVGIVTSENPPHPGMTVYSDKDIWEPRLLQDIFAASYAEWNLKTVAGLTRYYYEKTDPPTSINGQVYFRDISGQFNAKVNPKPPTVLGVGSCQKVNGFETCSEGYPGFSILTNGQTSSSTDINIFVPGQTIDLRFFAYADNNQMPIREIHIDWDDGSDGINTGGTSYYRNQRGSRNGTCTTSADPAIKKCQINNLFIKQDATGGNGTLPTDVTCKSDVDCRDLPVCVDSSKAPYFGVQKDISCNNSYFDFSGHAYACIRGVDSGTNWTDTCPDPVRFPTGCCVFRPKIQVKDNWGWCTGTCKKSDGTQKYPNGGCYADGKSSSGSPFDECDINRKDSNQPAYPWLGGTAKDIKVLMAPQ